MPARFVGPLALALLSAVAAAPSAHADTASDAAADAAIRRGVDLRRQGKDQDALAEFRKAYAAAKSARALAQIGLAEQALGRWADAESDLDEAMASKSDPWIRKNATTLSGAVEVIHRHLGSLEVIGPAGAGLRIDGRAAGTLPLKKPVRVPIGNVTVELRLEGFFPGTRPVSIAAGELARESIDLQPLSAAPPAPRTPPFAGSEPGAGSHESGGAPDHPPPAIAPIKGGSDEPGEAPGARRWQRPLAWSAAAAAVLGGLAGAGAILLRDRAVTDANNLQCMVANGTVNPPVMANRPRCLDLADRGETWRVTAIASLSAAGALAITAAILFITAPSSGSTGQTTAVSGLSCAPTLAAAGIACHLRF